MVQHVALFAFMLAAEFLAVITNKAEEATITKWPDARHDHTATSTQNVNKLKCVVIALSQMVGHERSRITKQ